MSEAITVRPQEAIETIRDYTSQGLPVCLWGSPGIGKSGSVQTCAEEDNLPLIDVRAATLDPTDIRGLPTIRDLMCTWTIPDFLPREDRDGKEGYFFLDELNRAMPLTMNGCFQLIQDRAIGNYHFPKGWHIIAACNREGDGGGIQKMPDALANRFVHLNFVAHIDDWIPWAVRHAIHPMTLAFLKSKPQLLDDYEAAKKANKLRKAFPTPRAWEKVSKVTYLKRSKKQYSILVSGIVGEDVACEYVGFLDIAANLPDLDDLIKNPKKGKIPEQLGALYAVVSGLAYKATAQNFQNIITYLNRIEAAEFCVMGVKEACQRDKTLKQTPEFMSWVENYQDVLF